MRRVLAFFSIFFVGSLRLGTVTLLCNFLGGETIFLDNLALFTIVFEAFRALSGEVDGRLVDGCLALD